MAHVLGIETSCDETAAAIVANGHRVLANVISSQVAKHAAYGGVIPELAAREHLEAVRPVVDRALRAANRTLSEIDAVAVTVSPGLLPALLVGIAYAKGIAAALNKPLVGVDHFLAHIFGAFLDEEAVLQAPATYPIIALVVSGGHTALALIDETGACRMIGRTLDDAAGEAFDKAAKLLRLGYPGGPIIDKLATPGDRNRYRFPRGLTDANASRNHPENRFNFSFSGVKTALLYHLREHSLADEVGNGSAPTAGNNKLVDSNIPQEILDAIASYQEAVVDVLINKSMLATAEFNAGTLVICGGVACNSRLRSLAMEEAAKRGIQLLIAKPQYCTDNAAMIAGCGYYQLLRGRIHALDLDARPRLTFPDYAPFARLVQSTSSRA